MCIKQHVKKTINLKIALLISCTFIHWNWYVDSVKYYCFDFTIVITCFFIYFENSEEQRVKINKNWQFSTEMQQLIIDACQLVLAG